MRIGVIADTHDRLPFIERAVQRLNEEEVELVLHAGDFIAPFVTSTFEPLEARMIAVFGNDRSIDEFSVKLGGSRVS